MIIFMFLPNRQLSVQSPREWIVKCCLMLKLSKLWPAWLQTICFKELQFFVHTYPVESLTWYRTFFLLFRCNSICSTWKWNRICRSACFAGFPREIFWAYPAIGVVRGNWAPCGQISSTQKINAIIIWWYSLIQYLTRFGWSNIQHTKKLMQL